MTVALDIIQGAMEELDVLGAIETPSAADANRALKALNLMLETWSLENLMCFVEVQVSAPLVAAQSTYTIGTSGSPNITAARPLRIERAFIRDPAGVDFMLELYARDRFDSLTYKATTSQPTALFYDATMPNGTIHLWPVPSDSTYTLFIDSFQLLQSFPTLATVFALPPGYEEALQHGLASRLAPYFGLPPDPQIDALVIGCKQLLKVKNYRDAIVGSDPALATSVRRDIYRGWP